MSSIPRKRIPVASHIRVCRGSYDHHGVYIGRGWVAHYSGWSSALSKGSIEKTTVDKFCSGGELAIVEHSDALPKVNILERAAGRLGEDKYSLAFNNCEHFSNWCVTGRHQSHQVKIFIFGGYVGLQMRGFFE